MKRPCILTFSFFSPIQNNFIFSPCVLCFKVLVAAAIGGTAEKLGGGKFANGAVTGAYVMMFNHMGAHGKATQRTKNMADLLFLMPEQWGNPFQGAAAIYGDIGFQILGAEQDVGIVFILTGEQKGEWFTYHEYSDKFGISIDANLGGEVGRIDMYGAPLSSFKAEYLAGEYQKAWVSYGPVGASVAWAKPDIKGANITIITVGVSGGFGGGLFFGGGAGYIIGSFDLLKYRR